MSDKKVNPLIASMVKAQMMLAIYDAEDFEFKEVKRSNLNWASLHVVVENINFDEFLLKLNGSNSDWADGL